jgi:hypothetical protein
MVAMLIYHGTYDTPVDPKLKLSYWEKIIIPGRFGFYNFCFAYFEIFFRLLKYMMTGEYKIIQVF